MLRNSICSTLNVYLLLRTSLWQRQMWWHIKTRWSIKSHIIFICASRLYKRLAGIVRLVQTCRRKTTNAFHINHVFVFELARKAKKKYANFNKNNNKKMPWKNRFYLELLRKKSAPYFRLNSVKIQAFAK